MRSRAAIYGRAAQHVPWAKHSKSSTYALNSFNLRDDTKSPARLVLPPNPLHFSVTAQPRHPARHHTAYDPVERLLICSCLVYLLRCALPPICPLSPPASLPPKISKLLSEGIVTLCSLLFPANFLMSAVNGGDPYVPTVATVKDRLGRTNLYRSIWIPQVGPKYGLGRGPETRRLSYASERGAACLYPTHLRTIT